MKWVTIKVVYGLPEAYIVKGALESEGIPTNLKYEAVGKIYFLTVDGLARVYIQVPEDRVEEAILRLQDLQNSTKDKL